MGRRQNRRKDKETVDHCPGFSDQNGIWNNGFPCPRWGGPDRAYCCGTNRDRFCCPPPPEIQAELEPERTRGRDRSHQRSRNEERRNREREREERYNTRNNAGREGTGGEGRGDRERIMATKPSELPSMETHHPGLNEIGGGGGGAQQSFMQKHLPILAGSAAGLLLLCCIILLAACFCCRKKKRQGKKGEEANGRCPGCRHKGVASSDKHVSPNHGGRTSLCTTPTHHEEGTLADLGDLAFCTLCKETDMQWKLGSTELMDSFYQPKDEPPPYSSMGVHSDTEEEMMKQKRHPDYVSFRTFNGSSSDVNSRRSTTPSFLTKPLDPRSQRMTIVQTKSSDGTKKYTMKPVPNNGGIPNYTSSTHGSTGPYTSGSFSPGSTGSTSDCSVSGYHSDRSVPVSSGYHSDRSSMTAITKLKPSNAHDRNSLYVTSELDEPDLIPRNCPDIVS